MQCISRQCNKKKTLVTNVIATIILALMVPLSMNYVLPSLAQSDETGEGTSSASQDYQEFQSCLSDAEVDGTVSEQQIRDCFAPIYNTGTASGTGTTTSSDSPVGDEGTTSADDTSSEGEEGEEASE